MEEDQEEEIIDLEIVNYLKKNKLRLLIMVLLFSLVFLVGYLLGYNNGIIEVTKNIVEPSLFC